jgi:methylmalonyl-CoA mutase cobalamin-binding domain/chain
LAEGLTGHINITGNVLLDVLPSEAKPIIDEYIEVGLTALTETDTSPPSFISSETPLNELATNYLDKLLQGERHIAGQLIMDAVDKGVSVKEIYLHVFQPVLHEVGRLWQTNQVSVAQEHYCTAATQLVMSQLYTHIFSTERVGRRLVATSVGSELHEIGVRMVADFFEMAGWDTYYLGANTPTESILQTLTQDDIDVLGISTTMTYHVSAAADLINRIRSSGAGKNVKIMVGGYPFNIDPNLWQNIKADGYARDAQEAIQVANRLSTGETL